MKRFKFDKPLVESPYPPESKNVLWVDINESTGSIISIKEFKKGDWVDIVSNQQLVDAGVDVNPNFPEPNEIYYRGELLIDTIPINWGYPQEGVVYPQVLNVEEITHPKWGIINKITFDNPLPEEFPWYMFSGMAEFGEGIVSIWLPKHTKSIPYAAFYHCSFLENVFLPEGLVSIGEKAFLGCSQYIRFNYNDDKGVSYFPSTLRLISNYALSQAFLGDIRFLGILDPCTSTYAFASSTIDSLIICGSEGIRENEFSMGVHLAQQRSPFSDDVVILNFTDLMESPECLLPGTQILVDVDGSTKSVEDIMVGDTIITYNNGQYAVAEVDKAINVKHTHYIDIIFEDDTKISISTDHAILTEEGWKSYRPFLTETPENVQPFYTGDKVLVNGKYVKIAKIILYTKPDTVMYNIGVKGHNNYIANGVCVYECSGSN